MEMKKYLSILLPGIVLSAVFLSCSEESVQSLFDDKYDQILYIKDGGNKNVSLFVTGQDTSYSFRVCKGGVDPNKATQASIVVRSQQDIDEEYGEGDYKVLPESAYKIETAQLDFTADDAGKLVSVQLLNDNIYKLTQQDTKARWMLPLLLTSSDSVNAEHNQYTLIIDNVTAPQVGFKKYGIDTLYHNPAKPLSLTLPVGVEGVENQWTVNVSIGVDAEYLKTFNEAHGTHYQLPAQYEIPETVTLTSDRQEVSVNASITNFGTQTQGYVMLPLAIKGVSALTVSPQKSRYVALIGLGRTRFDRSAWSATACSQQAQQDGEPDGSAMNAIDGDRSTHWHYKWKTKGTGSCASHPSKRHWLMLDTKTRHVFTRMGIWQDQSGMWPGAFVEKVKLYVSSDASVWGSLFKSSDQRWKYVGEYTLDLSKDQEIDVDLAPTAGRYVTLEVSRGGWDADAGSFSEVYFYGEGE